MSRARDIWQRTLDFCLHTEASTRSSALMRVLLVFCIWARWANEWIIRDHMEDGRWPLSVLFFVSTTLALMGAFTRVAMPMLAATTFTLVYYVGHAQGHEAYIHHHTTLLAWSSLLLTFTPCGKSYSFDRFMEVRRAERNGVAPPPERANVWGLRLLALQVSSVYFWAALDKVNVGFLSGARIQHITMFYYTGSAPLEDIALAVPATTAIALSTVVLEFALAFGLWSKRGRLWLAIPGLLLHGIFYMLLSVYTFTVTMWVLYLAFFDPDEIHALIERVSGHTPAPPS